MDKQTNASAASSATSPAPFTPALLETVMRELAEGWTELPFPTFSRRTIACAEKHTFGIDVQRVKPLDINLRVEVLAFKVIPCIQMPHDTGLICDMEEMQKAATRSIIDKCVKAFAMSALGDGTELDNNADNIGHNHSKLTPFSLSQHARDRNSGH